MIVNHLQTLIVTFAANVKPYIQGIQQVLTANAQVNAAASATIQMARQLAQSAGAFVSKTASSALTLTRSVASSIYQIIATVATAPNTYGPRVAQFFSNWRQHVRTLGTSLVQVGQRIPTIMGNSFIRLRSVMTTAYANLPNPGQLLAAGFNGLRTVISGASTAARVATSAFGSMTSVLVGAGGGLLSGISSAISSIGTQLHNAAVSVGQFSAQWVNAGKHIRAAGKLMSLYITAPLLLVGGLSTTAFAKFDQAMTETFARMGRQTKEVREQMEGLALSLSTKGTVAASPVKLAKGYIELGAAGLNAAQSMAAIEDVAILAQAGMFGTDVAVKQLIGSMSSFGAMSNDPVVFASNLRRFSDVMVNVANTTTTGVEEVARAMSADGAVAAKNYGMTIEELGAILGVYAMQNKDAEEAGHLTGRAIRLLTASFQRNGDTWKKFGIDIVDQSTGQYVKFSKAIGMIEGRMKGMSGPMRTAFLDLLGFETLAQKSILPLIGQSKELERQEGLYKQVGSAQEMAKIQMESFTNQMKILWNVFTVVGIEVGKILAPYIHQLTKFVATGVAYWRTFSKEMKVTTIAVFGVVAALGPAVVLFSVVASVIGYVGYASIWAFAVMSTAVTSVIPILLGVAFAGYVVYKMIAEVIQQAGGLASAWDGFKAATWEMFSDVSTVFTELYKLWVVVGTGFAEVGIWAFTSLISLVSSWSGGTMSLMGLTWSNAISWIAEWVRFARFAFQNAGMVLSYMFTRMQYLGVVFLADAAHLFTVQLPAVFMYLAENWFNILDTMYNYGSTVFMNLVGNIARIFANLPGLISGTVNLADIWTPLEKGFVNLMTKMPEIPARVVGETEKALLAETKAQEAMIADAYGQMVEKDIIEAQMAKEQDAIAKAAAKGMEDTGKAIMESAKDLNKTGKEQTEEDELLDQMLKGKNKPSDTASTGGDSNAVGRWSNDALHRIAAYTEAGPGMPTGKIIGTDGNLTDPTARASTATSRALETTQSKEDAATASLLLDKKMEENLAKVVAILLKFQADSSKPVDTTLLPAGL